jgi:hypothetical protein
MMRLFSNKSVLSFLGLLITICHLYAAAGGAADQVKSPAVKPGIPGQKLNEQPAVKPADKSPIMVARISDYVITREELEKRLMMELYPRDYDRYGKQNEPVAAKTVLMKMIAEKAMVLEARKHDYLKDETIYAPIKRFKERKLVTLLGQKYVEGKIIVTEEEIKQKMQADPKLDEAKAKAALEKAKANRILSLYYSQIYKKFHVRKLRENFPSVVQSHQRLLYRPKIPRNVGFIRASQVKDELTPEEKNIVLAEYDYGKVTLKNWFEALCEIVPPSRPKDLNTPKGVEQLLEGALRMPLLVSEAKLAGLNKDKDLLEQVKEYEDRVLLNHVKSAKYKEVKEPTTEQIIAYFTENKESFGTSDNLKIDLIWCQDLGTARKAKAELDLGKDFELVKQEYSLEKKGKPFNTYPRSEGLFWKDLWAGNPNEIVGPVKGFYRRGIKWRIVKILEKNLGEPKEYSNDMERQIKSRMMSEQQKALVAKYGKELLKEYRYQIFDDRIKDIDPLNIP